MTGEERQVLQVMPAWVRRLSVVVAIRGWPEDEVQRARAWWQAARGADRD